jgi:hypothetical protein
MTSQMTGQSELTDAVLPAMDLHFAGIDKELELAVRFAPSFQAAGRAAASLAHMISLHPGVPVRLAGVEVARSRVHLTIAVSLGALGDLKVAGPSACSSVAFMRALVSSMAAFDPAFVQLPDPASREASQARMIPIVEGSSAHRAVPLEQVLRSA